MSVQILSACVLPNKGATEAPFFDPIHVKIKYVVTQPLPPDDSLTFKASYVGDTEIPIRTMTVRSKRASTREVVMTLTMDAVRARIKPTDDVSSTGLVIRCSHGDTPCGHIGFFMASHNPTDSDDRRADHMVRTGKAIARIR